MFFYNICIESPSNKIYLISYKLYQYKFAAKENNKYEGYEPLNEGIGMIKTGSESINRKWNGLQRSFSRKENKGNHTDWRETYTGGGDKRTRHTHQITEGREPLAGAS